MHALVFLAVLAVAAPAQQVNQYTISPEEGLTLPLRFYAPAAAGAPTVVVVHDWGGSMERWTDIAERLQGFGFGVVLFNLRGHGGSTTAYYYFNLAQVDAMRKDVSMAIRFARERGPGRVYVIGAGLGANLAISVAAEEGRVDRVVAISPGLNYLGIVIEEPLAELPPERIMLISSLEDVYSVFSVRKLLRLFAEPPESRTLNNAGHGVWILKRQPGMVDSIAAWLIGPS